MLACGEAHSMAVVETAGGLHELYTWGDGDYGQLASWGTGVIIVGFCRRWWRASFGESAW